MQDTRTIEWLQFATNVILAGIGVFALVIYGGQLRVMKGQLNEIIRQYPDIHAQAVAATAALQESTKAFRIDERAWIEIEPIKPELRAPQDEKFPAISICNIYPKNVGKTVARDIVVRTHDFGAGEEFGNNADTVRSMQDKMLLGGFKEMGTNKPVIIPSNPMPRVLAPNSISPVPFTLTCAAPQTYAGGHQWMDYMIGRVDYCDQFQVKHWLKFCFFVVNSRGEIWACQQGNDEDENTEAQTPETACAKAN